MNFFLRFIFLLRVEEDDAYYLKVLSSSDRGGTWSLVQDDISVEAGGVVGRDRFGLELVGIENGQFMFAYQNQRFYRVQVLDLWGSGAFTHDRVYRSGGTTRSDQTQLQGFIYVEDPTIFGLWCLEIYTVDLLVSMTSMDPLKLTELKESSICFISLWVRRSLRALSG